MTRLFISYYIDKSVERQREIDACLIKNIENPLIDEIHLLVEYPLDELVLLAEPKIKTIHIKSRPTHAVFYDYINSIAPGDNDLSIVANSDIYFDDTLSKINIMNHECLALCRYDLKKSQVVFMNSWDSQDTWIFRGRIRKVVDCDFNLGLAGTDNAIAERLYRAGYKVSNPSRTIRTFHLHETGIHNYNPSEKVPKPYKFLNPTA